MALKENDITLLSRIHHTNKTIPYSDYVSGAKFPKQDESILGECILLKFRNMYITDREYRNEEQFEEHDIYEKPFFILRCDMEEPFTVIGISMELDQIIVANYNNYKDAVYMYAIQMNEYIGAEVTIRYPGDTNLLKGTIISCDDGECCNAVIVENYTKDSIRVITDYEAEIVLDKDFSDQDLVEKELAKEMNRIKEVRKNSLEGKILYESDRYIRID